MYSLKSYQNHDNVTMYQKNVPFSKKTFSWLFVGYIFIISKVLSSYKIFF